MQTPPPQQQSISLLQKSYTESPKLRDLLQPGTRRFENFSRKFKGLLFDFSRVAVSGEAMDQLLAWAGEADIAEQRKKMFGGEAINNSENRPVLHHLWRSRDFSKHLPADEAGSCGQSLQRLEKIAAALHAGYLPGSPEITITDVVHIGIGGSLIGPKLLCDALSPGLDAPSIHFLSSVDAYDRECLLAWLDPATTAIVMVSKSFTTTEVLAHGRHMRDWMRSSLGEAEANRRLVAVTSAPAKAVAFGVPEQQVLAMGEWTGGRYSIWSPVGLTVAVSAGPQAFAEFCKGGEAMDQHFRTAPAADNLPILHGLLSVWHRNICGYSNRGLIPYDSRLRGLPAWLQQLQMESNGKSVTRDGEPVSLQTSPMVFGDSGTDAQHALFQAFHQGTEVVPLDFVGVVRPDHDDIQSQKELLSHLLAQATALAFGRNEQETRGMMQAEGKPPEQIEFLLPHRLMPGNRPSSILLLDQLTPENVGHLLALYEHSIFVESVIWRINAFDQWGVELGKILAGRIEAAMTAETDAGSAELASLQGIMREITSRLG